MSGRPKCRVVSNYGRCNRRHHDRSDPHATFIGGGSDPFTDPGVWFVWEGRNRPVGYRALTLDQITRRGAA